MALQFCLVLLCGLLLLLIPGAIVFRSLKLTQPVMLCCVPATSIALYSVCGLLLGFANIGSSTVLLFSSLLLSIALSLAISILTRKTTFTHSPNRADRFDALTALIYVVVGLTTMYLIFVKPMSSVEAFVQYDDNATHLGKIACMVDDGVYSILETSSYPRSLPAEQIPFNASSFYPNGWHTIAALSCSLAGASIPVAENATNVLFTAVVFPLGAFALIHHMFPGQRAAQFAGAFVCLASASFPLRMLTVHGPFPNVAAFCLIPSYGALFLSSFPAKDSIVRWDCFTALFISSIGVATTHPNAIFSCIALFAPYLILKVIPFCINRQTSTKRFSRFAYAHIAQTICCALILAAWVLILKTPAFSGVANYVWRTQANVTDLVRGIIDAGYYYRTSGMTQFAFAILVAIGFGTCARERHTRWIAVSFLVIAFIFLLGLSLDFETRKIITGYWYNDPERISAMVAIAAVPLAAIGLQQISECICWGLRQIRSVPKGLQTLLPYTLVVLVAIPFSALNYYPEKFLSADAASEDVMYFAKQQLRSVYNFSDTQLYTADERRFVQRASELIPDGSLVLNFPFDGSVFAYPADGLNVYYKSCRPNDETLSSRVIREGLNDISTNSSVAQAVRYTGAEYVIILDVGNLNILSNNSYTPLATYHHDMWQGFLIDDETPGFECILADGNMRLFRVGEVAAQI